MPITSSGEIALIADIEAEFGQTGTDNISMTVARDAAGLPSGEVAMSDFYGISDVVAPTVTTVSSSLVGSTVTLTGNITSDGGGSITQRGFYFGTSSNYSSNSKSLLGAGSTGTYTHAIATSSSTTYYYTAYAVNAAGESVGSTLSFTTPWVITTAAMGSLSEMYNNAVPTGSPYANSVHYYKTNYSGSIYANSRYNNTHPIFNGYRRFNATGGYPFDDQLVTNSDQMLVFGVGGGGQFSNKYTQLDITRSGSRGFSNQSAVIPFGTGTIWSNFTSHGNTRMRAYVTNGSWVYSQYIGIQFRYS